MNNRRQDKYAIVPAQEIIDITLYKENIFNFVKAVQYQPSPCSFRVAIFHHKDFKLFCLIVHCVKCGHKLLLLLLVPVKEDDHDVVRLVNEHLQGVLVHIPDCLALQLLQDPGLDFNWIIQVT